MCIRDRRGGAHATWATAYGAVRAHCQSQSRIRSGPVSSHPPSRKSLVASLLERVVTSSRSLGSISAAAALARLLTAFEDQERCTSAPVPSYRLGCAAFVTGLWRPADEGTRTRRRRSSAAAVLLDRREQRENESEQTEQLAIDRTGAMWEGRRRTARSS